VNRDPYAVWDALRHVGRRDAFPAVFCKLTNLSSNRLSGNTGCRTGPKRGVMGGLEFVFPRKTRASLAVGSGRFSRPYNGHDMVPCELCSPCYSPPAAFRPVLRASWWNSGSRPPFAARRSGQAGPFETLSGHFYGETGPETTPPTTVSSRNIALAPAQRTRNGGVHSNFSPSSKPIDMTKASGVLFLHSVPNRGGGRSGWARRKVT